MYPAAYVCVHADAARRGARASGEMRRLDNRSCVVGVIVWSTAVCVFRAERNAEQTAWLHGRVKVYLHRMEFDIDLAPHLSV